jgi:isoquinoline 1-oxidoreductase alpha subunit
VNVTLRINGQPVSLDAAPQEKLLWVLRDRLGLTGTRYGCGLAQCGACMVLVDGVRSFACQLPIEAMQDREITTIEGLNDAVGTRIKEAWLAHRVPQCGYCQSGMMISAASLLRASSTPSEQEIVDHMSTNLCRCGTYRRIVQAIQAAAAPADGKKAGA